MRCRAGTIAGVILYGLVAGLAATTVTILGPTLLAVFFVWAFDSLGWKSARDAAVTFLSLYIFITGIGLIVGVTVCIRVCITRLRPEPTPGATAR